MLKVQEFLEIPALSGKSVSEQDFSDSWDQMGEQSRALYSKTQRHGGGSKTKKAPLDFDFHKRNLTEAELDDLKARTLELINPEEREILARYLD